MKQRQFALGTMSAQQFLRDYWQKKPLLIKQALPNFINPISPDEIAGLACEEQIESRLIRENDIPPYWHLQHGPFDEDVFSELPESHWTLHIQSVDQYLPEIYSLIDHFRFIPNWRIDDVMVSYSPNMGTAGPHFDQYDVFLIQGLGNKRWQIGQKCDASTLLLKNSDLSIVNDFQVNEEWLVEPGDILYIPPQYAHYGIAEGDGITYSIGFRAPSYSDLLGEFSLYQSQKTTSHQRYQDKGLELQAHSGEITSKTIDKVQKILLDKINDKQALAEWFGNFVTEQKSEIEDDTIVEPINGEQLIELLEGAKHYFWREGTRFSYTQNGKHIRMHINGNSYTHHISVLACVQALCSASRISTEELDQFTTNEECLELLCLIYNNGDCYYL